MRCSQSGIQTTGMTLRRRRRRPKKKSLQAGQQAHISVNIIRITSPSSFPSSLCFACKPCFLKKYLFSSFCFFKNPWLDCIVYSLWLFRDHGEVTILYSLSMLCNHNGLRSLHVNMYFLQIILFSASSSSPLHSPDCFHFWWLFPVLQGCQWWWWECSPFLCQNVVIF